MFIGMNAVYHLDAEELDETFLQGLKQTFQKRRLEIIVREEDETEYLLSSPANRRQLLTAQEDVQSDRNLLVPDQALFQ
jgi:antitoxin YefM